MLHNKKIGSLFLNTYCKYSLKIGIGHYTVGQQHHGLEIYLKEGRSAINTSPAMSICVQMHGPSLRGDIISFAPNFLLPKYIAFIDIQSHVSHDTPSLEAEKNCKANVGQQAAWSEP